MSCFIVPSTIIHILDAQETLYISRDIMTHGLRTPAAIIHKQLNSPVCGPIYELASHSVRDQEHA